LKGAAFRPEIANIKIRQSYHTSGTENTWNIQMHNGIYAPDWGHGKNLGELTIRLVADEYETVFK
jgi:hypothetical protein